MANEVEKFDPALLMQGVKDRIKATFISLIPDDKWEQMCKTEIDRFFKGDPEGQYRNKNYSEFTYVVNGVLTDVTKEKVKAILSGPEYKSHWNGSEYTVSEEIDKILTKNAPKIIATMLGNMMQEAINQMNYNK
jgi:hypothetical protein